MTIVTVVILCFIQMLMYMDRLAVASVLKDIQKTYNMDDQEGGLVQTVFFGFFVVFSPLFGYVGDRVTRKWVLTFGITAWICLVVVSTIIPGHQKVLFLVARGLVGVGQSCCSVLAPSIIADIYTGTKRSMSLMMFFFMIPVGSGMGFLCGSRIGSLFGSWRYGVGFTAALGVLVAILHIFFSREPRRGGLEGVVETERAKSFWMDCRKIVRIPTFLLSTGGLTCVMFLTGSLEWWAPTLIEHSKARELHLSDTNDLSDSQVNNITLVTGGITLISGLLGVIMGSFAAHWLKTGKYCFKPFKTQCADPIVCTVGALVCVPSMFIGFQLIHTNLTVTYALFFIGITAACCNLAVVVDLQLSVIVPLRRNAANSLQTMVSSLLGDATGPYIVGLISDSVRHGSTPSDHYHSLIKAFYFPCAALALATVLFFLSAFTTKKDLRNYQREIENEQDQFALEKEQEMDKF